MEESFRNLKFLLVDLVHGLAIVRELSLRVENFFLKALVYVEYGSVEIACAVLELGQALVTACLVIQSHNYQVSINLFPRASLLLKRIFCFLQLPESIVSFLFVNKIDCFLVVLGQGFEDILGTFLAGMSGHLVEVLALKVTG